MPPVFSYTEKTEDVSPTVASFTARQQSTSGVYLTFPNTFADMPNRLIDVLGYTGTQVPTGAPPGQPNAGKINRVLPLRHPQYQWLFADSWRPRAKGSNLVTITPGTGGGSSIIPQFPLYQTYEADIAFSSRDYNCWQDSDITIGASNGVDREGNNYGYTFAPEWLRYCKFELRPLNNFIDAKMGQMKFRNPGGGAPSPDGVQYQDAPKMYLPDSALKVKWFSVPYRYVTSANSYLRNFIGHINQKAWGDAALVGGGFGPFAKGSLLFHGAVPVAIYPNTVPDEGLLHFNPNAGAQFSKSLLCDLELEFTYTARIAGAPSTLPAPSNTNWLAAGHNLLPWLTTRLFYYATTTGPGADLDPTQWRPTFYSFPFELLFTDPDVPYAGGIGSPVFSAAIAPIGP